MTPGGLRIAHQARLSDAETAAVRALVTAASDADGVTPLSEHVMLHLRYGGDERVHNLLAWDGTDLVGYAHLDITDEVSGASAELVVHPERRDSGVGPPRVAELLPTSPDRWF